MQFDGFAVRKLENLTEVNWLHLNRSSICGNKNSFAKEHLF